MLRSVFWLGVFVGYLAGSVAWCRLMPGGFPFTHPRFWANRVLPFALIAVAVSGVIGAWLRKPKMLLPSVASVVAFWNALSISLVVIFPLSARRFGPPLFMWMLVLWAAALRQRRGL